MTKLLSDSELHILTAKMAKSGVLYSEMIDIIAQAKLANRIQKQAAEICLSEKVENDGNDGDTGYNMACDHCHKEILAMEI